MTEFVLGGGCFWCLDAVFRRLKGVSATECGYSGGDLPSPSYHQVATGLTGHIEVVKLHFDETIIPAETILDIFFLIHNPTTKDQQGADVGSQYRSVMFYTDQKQRTLFENALQRAQNNWDQPIVTEISPLKQYYKAEEEHQDYFSKHPDAGYCQIVIAPKVNEARKEYTNWFKEV
jgi:peptide-methionine (S)-S-oxide reductase